MTTVRRIKVGLVGLGEVAQIIHLPVLSTLQDKYEIYALCDISPKVLEAVGRQYQVERLFADAAEMAALPELDAVFVLNSDEYHTDAVVASASRGKHVLVEKPMCLTQREAEEIIAARDEAGVQVMVGYMRRFAPAYLMAAEELRKMKNIHYARIRDLIGHNHYFINQSSSVQRFQDYPAGALEERARRGLDLVREAIGDVSEDIRNAYRLLCGLSSHDLSAMRELLGFPKRVLAASQWNGGRFMNAIFEFDGFHATFETGVDEVRRFDAHIEVNGDDKLVRVQYDTPFIRHLPTTLVVQETVGEAYRETVVRPTFKDPYTYELEHFYEVAVGNALPKTTPEDYMEDLRLFAMMIDGMKQSSAG